MSATGKIFSPVRKNISPTEEFESLTGRGIRGRVGGTRYYIGNRRLLEEQRITIDPQLAQEANRLEAEAQTVIWLADEHEALAVAAIADRVKPTSAQAIHRLQRQGIDVHLLTGDNEATARAIAAQTGIRHYRANVLPQEKQPTSAAFNKREKSSQWWATASTTVQPWHRLT